MSNESDDNSAKSHRLPRRNEQLRRGVDGSQVDSGMCALGLLGIGF